MRAMYWDDFRKIVRGSERPWRTVKYYRSKGGFKDTMSICDFSLPRRSKHLKTKAGAESDWYRDSFVCNAGWLGGQIPIDTNPSVYNYKTQKWETWPMRGARDVMQVLVGSGVCERTPEIDVFIRTGYWRW